MLEGTLVRVRKKKLKIKLRVKIDKKLDSFQNNTNYTNNITLKIEEIPIKETNTLLDKSCLKEICKEDLTISSKSQLSNANVNDTLDSEPIKYKTHYVSFIILYPFDYGIVGPPDTNFLIGLNMLIRENKFIPKYKINYTPDFKYKKFIRSKVLEDFNFKNKDIEIIKSVNLYKNYHNYIVVLKKYSVRHKLYGNEISSVENKYKWKQTYDLFNPAKMTPKIKQVTLKDAYNYLITNSKLKFQFTDSKLNNLITIKDIYKSITQVIQND
tara:strand:- start:1021 stop:1827 length:807 start_codon:yes stop_codon:yes gene_type:complete